MHLPLDNKGCGELDIGQATMAFHAWYEQSLLCRYNTILLIHPTACLHRKKRGNDRRSLVAYSTAFLRDP